MDFEVVVYNRRMSSPHPNFKPRNSPVESWGAMVCLLLAACAAPLGPAATPAPTQPAMATATPTPALDTTYATPAATAAPPSAQLLRLWLPPQFAPSPDTPEGKLMLAQIAAFEKERSGWSVEVRIKKLAGQGGLLDALQTTLKAAPSAAPDVIALDGAMLLTAAPMLQPLTPFLPDEELADFFPFAVEGAHAENELLGLPFAADALGLAYSTVAYASPPQSWADLKVESGPLWLPLADQTALVTLLQYRALGGGFTNDAGAPAMDAPVLARVLAHYQSMEISGVLPTASTSATELTETWTAFRENRAVAAAAWADTYLANRRRIPASGFTLLPTPDGSRVTFARQWNYALVTSDPARQAVAVALMRWLAAPENSGPWTAAASVLPARAKALDSWAGSGVSNVAAEALSAAQPVPPSSLLAALGPPVAAAVLSVLAGQASPEAAAQTAAAAVGPR